MSLGPCLFSLPQADFLCEVERWPPVAPEPPTSVEALVGRHCFYRSLQEKVSRENFDWSNWSPMPIPEPVTDARDMGVQ